MCEEHIGTLRLDAHLQPTRIHAPPRTTAIRADLSVIDPSYNLAAGAAVVGTICGGLEDIKDGEGKKLLTAPFFGGLAVLLVVFGAFIAFQTTSVRRHLLKKAAEADRREAVAGGVSMNGAVAKSIESTKAHD